jgi:uracil phosphoribosyltransferase
MNNEEILKEVKKTISRIAAIRILRSGNIDVIILNKVFKNKTHGLLLTEELKIYKKEYLIEIPDILFNVHVICEKGADNTRLTTAICEASRIVSPGL